MRLQPALLSSPPTTRRPPAPPPAPLEPGVLDTVAARVESWGHQGKKLGSLGVVAAGASVVPIATAIATMRLAGDSMALLGPLTIATSIGSMALLAFEETQLGLGRKLGHAVGAAAGAVAGAIEGGVRSLVGSDPKPAQVELPRRAPTGKAPYEALLPRGIHAAERALTGSVAPRSRGAEIGEMAGATLGTLAVAYAVPRVAGELIPGPLGLAAGSLVGSLLGMVVGGWEETTLGLGRGLGELAGRAVSSVFGTEPSAPSSPSTPAPLPQPSALKKGFLKFNHLIGQPLIGFLVDATLATNPLFAEKPYEVMAFTPRPAPQVDRERLIGNFIKLAGIHGPSGDERLVGEELGRQLDALGVKWEKKADGTLIGTVPATPGQEDAPTVMLSAHQDTVEPTRPEAIVRGERRIHTDETHILGADDRAGLAEILEGLTVVLEQKLPHPELKLVFTVDEERGLVGASRLTPEDISSRPTLGFVVDSLDTRDVHLTNDAVIVARNSVKYNFSQEDPLVQVVFRSMANAGQLPRPIHAPILTGAGSDANTLAFNSKHVRSIAVGAGERDMHTPLEHIQIDDLVQAARNVVGYLTNSCDLKVEGERIVPRKEL